MTLSTTRLKEANQPPADESVQGAANARAMYRLVFLSALAFSIVALVTKPSEDAVSFRDPVSSAVDYVNTCVQPYTRRMLNNCFYLLGLSAMAATRPTARVG
jgi:hypothetical protein